MSSDRDPADRCDGLHTGLSWTDLRQDLAECGFGQVPIHAEGLDQVSILYAKDILPHRNRDAFDWTNLLRLPISSRKTG